jgi:hypothetical protein
MVSEMINVEKCQSYEQSLIGDGATLYYKLCVLTK